LLNMIKKLNFELFNPIVLLKEEGPLSSELVKAGAVVFFEKTISMVPYNSSIIGITSMKNLLSILVSFKKVSYWIKKTNADIVHVNTMMMYPYLILAHKLGKKSIIHVRENWPINEHKFQFKLAQSVMKKYADRIIAINEFAAKMIGVPNKTIIIYDWIDFQSRNKQTDFVNLFGEDAKSLKVFLFLGGTIWLKGALDVVDVFSSQVLTENVRLLLVGCDNKELDFHGCRGFIKKIFNYFNYNTYSNKVKLIAQRDDRIVFLPATYQVKSLMEQSFCLVSSFTIPHANLSLAESVWLGKPAIAAYTPEAKEYCNDGNAALLFEMNNKEQLKEKILFSLENEKFVSDNAINGMKIIQYKFDPLRNSLLLNNIYVDLIK
jgi:glycosyltransferase involved in cell wall biosynthesis